MKTALSAGDASVGAGASDESTESGSGMGVGTMNDDPASDCDEAVDGDEVTGLSMATTTSTKANATIRPSAGNKRDRNTSYPPSATCQ
jgi:hypothetical protein